MNEYEEEISQHVPSGGSEERDAEEAMPGNHGWSDDDALPDNRAYPAAAGFLGSNNFSSVIWRADARGFAQPVSHNPIRLRHWAEDFYLFKNCVYRKRDQFELRAKLISYLNSKHYFDSRKDPRLLKVGRGFIGDVEQQLAALTQVRGEEMPMWLPGAGDHVPDPKRVVAFYNGLLSIDDWLIDPDIKPIPVTPHWFSVVVQPCAYDPKAKCPKWISFLNRALSGDHELISIIQEWFGYCLTSDTSLQKMLWLHGVSGAGKGTLIRVFRAVVGQDNSVSFNLWNLLERFVLQSFLQKRVAISGDAHLGNHHDAERVLAILKGMTGEDEQLVDRKNKDLLSSVRFSTRFVISTNEFPSLPDASDAMGRRIIFIPFTHTVRGSENTRLGDELIGELPGITIWALIGLRRLLENDGKFTNSSAATSVMDEFKRLQSPVWAFVSDCLETSEYKPRGECGSPATGCISCSECYSLFEAWCEDNGRTPCGSSKFGERLKRAVPEIKRERVGSIAGQSDKSLRPYEYRGIQVRAGISISESHQNSRKAALTMFDG